MDYSEKVYQKLSNFISRRIADEVVLVPIRQDVADLQSIYTLNEVGAFIWDRIDGKKRVKDIREMITKEFEVDDDTAGDDLINLIGQLEEINTIGLLSKEAVPQKSP